MFRSDCPAQMHESWVGMCIAAQIGKSLEEIGHGGTARMDACISICAYACHMTRQGTDSWKALQILRNVNLTSLIIGIGETVVSPPRLRPPGSAHAASPHLSQLKAHCGFTQFRPVSITRKQANPDFTPKPPLRNRDNGWLSSISRGRAALL